MLHKTALIAHERPNSSHLAHSLILSPSIMRRSSETRDTGEYASVGSCDFLLFRAQYIFLTIFQSHPYIHVFIFSPVVPLFLAVCQLYSQPISWSRHLSSSRHFSKSLHLSRSLSIEIARRQSVSGYHFSARSPPPNP